MALAGSAFTFMITTLGALNVFFVKKNMGESIQRIFLGFAGGVMVAASIWSLLVPGIETAEKNGQIGWIVVPGGFLLGVIFLLITDRLLEKRYSGKNEGRECTTRIRKDTLMLIIAMTVHNIPEGFAVGLACALAGANPGDAGLLSGAFALSLGIGIQNYPEGTAVALPLISEGCDRKKAFGIGVLSAAVEPLAAVVAALIAGCISRIIPVFLAFAAGTMIYVVVEELIPQAHMGEKDNVGTLGFITGFMVMMILDVALG